MSGFWIYRFPAVVWMLFIYFLSSIPGPKLPPVSFPYVHLIAHLVEYSAVGFLLVCSFSNSIGTTKWIFAAGMAFVIVSLFAASDEYHQTFVAGRNGEMNTVFLDMLFSVFGMGFYGLFRRLVHKRFL